MSSHPEPFLNFRPVTTDQKRTDKPGPGELVCMEFGDWGMIAADAWLLQNADQHGQFTWRATDSAEMATWWDGTPETEMPTEQWARPIADVPGPDETRPFHYYWFSVASDADRLAVLWNTMIVMEYRAGILRQDPPAPTKVARYYVVFDRQVGEQDYATASVGRPGSTYEGSGHDGTARGAMEQLARELQEAIDADGAVDGVFMVVGREVVDGFDTPMVPPAQWPMEGDPA